MFSSIATILCAALLVSELPPDTNRTASAGSLVRMTVTAGVDPGKRLPQVEKEDVFVKKGKERLPVTEWVAAKGDRAGLELFLLIDDASTSTLGLQL